jgi:hypothetical protein
MRMVRRERVFVAGMLLIREEQVDDFGNTRVRYFLPGGTVADVFPNES